MIDLKLLGEKAARVRTDIVDMICRAKSGHPGGSLSSVETVIALYNGIMNIDPSNPSDEGRDRFVLSKGHAAPVLYAVLADRGYIDRSILKTLRQVGSPLQGHPDMSKVKGVEISTGSLGQGLSVANGMAISAKIYKKDYRVFALLGDGELQEGQVWEAVMTAAHYKLDNLTIFIDYNNLQIDGKLDEIKNVYPIEDKFRAFGWETSSIDGHNFEEIFAAVEKAKSTKTKPTAIVLNTVKGKGISFMENVCDFHGKAPTADEAKRAIEELGNVFSIEK